MLLHGGDDLRVDADPGVGDEPAVIGPAQADGARATCPNPVQDQACCLDRVVGQAQRPDEDIPAALLQRGQRIFKTGSLD